MASLLDYLFASAVCVAGTKLRHVIALAVPDQTGILILILFGHQHVLVSPTVFMAVYSHIESTEIGRALFAPAFE